MGRGLSLVVVSRWLLLLWSMGFRVLIPPRWALKDGLFISTCWAVPCRPVLAQLQDDERARSQQQRYQWFNAGGAYISEAKFWSDTLLCTAHGRPDEAADFTPGGRRD